MKPQPDIRVSVVVPTKDRPTHLHRCLEAIDCQVLPGHRFEIIVVDDGQHGSAKSAVEQKASSRRHSARIQYLRSMGPGPAAARNTGWRAAEGDIIAFTDDDCVPQPEWLAAGLEAMAAGVDAVSGRIVVPLPRHPTDYQLNAANLEQAEFATANCFYRRDVLDRLHGFDERFTLAWREDTDLFYRLLELGLPMARAENALVVHPVRQAGWGVSLHQQSKSSFNALLYRKHPHLYRTRLPPSPIGSYYMILGAFLLGLISRLCDRVSLSWISGSVWVILTGQFCLRRLRGTSRSPTHVMEMMVTSALIPPIAIFWRLSGAIRYRVWFF